MADLEINLRLTPSRLRWAAVAFLICGFARDLSTESLTLTTSYPAPLAVYNVLITTGNTYLARDPGAKVGIATTNPQALLDVNGAARTSGDFTAAGKVSAQDVLAAGQSVITTVTCSGGISCSKSGNSLTITQP